MQIDYPQKIEDSAILQAKILMKDLCMSNLTDLKNIGPSLAAVLERAGVTSAEALKKEGSREVFRRLKEQGEPGM